MEASALEMFVKENLSKLYAEIFIAGNFTEEVMDISLYFKTISCAYLSLIRMLYIYPPKLKPFLITARYRHKRIVLDSFAYYLRVSVKDI